MKKNEFEIVNEVEIVFDDAGSGENKDEKKSEESHNKGSKVNLSLVSPPPPGPVERTEELKVIVNPLRDGESSQVYGLKIPAAGLLREPGGLIGSPTPIRQFCGSVLIVLALAIATTVAAVAVMSMLGVATPAFLVPYLAAIQASSMVSTVLNFVAAKLTLDLNTAAAVTAVATAGTLGMFGRAVQHSGAPTKLNCDTEAAKSMKKK